MKALWIALAIVITAAVSITGSVLLMSKTIRKDYQKQIDKQNQTIVELAKIAKYSISNTYTIKKVKGKSQLVLVPENDMTINEVTRGLDETINNLTPADTLMADTVKKTFWDKIKNIFK